MLSFQNKIWLHHSLAQKFLMLSFFLWVKYSFSWNARPFREWTWISSPVSSATSHFNFMLQLYCIWFAFVSLLTFLTAWNIASTSNTHTPSCFSAQLLLIYSFNGSPMLISYESFPDSHHRRSLLSFVPPMISPHPGLLISLLNHFPIILKLWVCMSIFPQGDRLLQSRVIFGLF